MNKEANGRKKFKIAEKIKWYVFLLPITIGILLFMLYPILESLRLSFYKTNGMQETFRRLENYQIVLQDALFWKAVWNTIYISFFNIFLVIPISFMLACLINEMRLGKNFSKAMFFISYITPGIAASTIFLFVFHPQGIMNMLLEILGIPPITWLGEPITAQWSVIIYSVWKNLGFNMIIFLASLQSIPKEIYEAASVDGSAALQKWRYITIPNMKATIATLTLMAWIGGFQRFSDVFIFGNGSQGSPERSLFTIVSYIYERGFGNYEFGVASAASYILFLIIVVFTVANKKISKLTF